MQGKERTLIDVIGELVNPSSVKIIDNSCNGNCSRCGECCTPFLPMSQDELDNIQEYVIKNNIPAQQHLQVMENKMTCPYYNGKKCLIYEVRPLICREFYCYKEPTAKIAMKFAEKKYVPVDFWAIAKCFERLRKDYERTKRTM